MEITHTFEDGICIVRLVGNLVGTNVPVFKEYLVPCIEDPAFRVLIVNLQEVEFLSSSGISVVISSSIKVRRMGGQMMLTNLNSNTQESLKISGVSKVIPTYPTLEEALASLEK